MMAEEWSIYTVAAASVASMIDGTSFTGRDVAGERSITVHEDTWVGELRAGEAERLAQMGMIVEPVAQAAAA